MVNDHDAKLFPLSSDQKVTDFLCAFAPLRCRDYPQLSPLEVLNLRFKLCQLLFSPFFHWQRAVAQNPQPHSPLCLKPMR